MWKPWLRPTTFLSLVLILLPISHAYSQETQSLTLNKKPIVVMVEKTEGHLVWTVDSKVADDPLHALAVLGERRGHDTPVVVLLSKHVPLDMIWNVEGTAWKAQLDRLRFFLIDREFGTMREISRGPAVPSELIEDGRSGRQQPGARMSDPEPTSYIRSDPCRGIVKFDDNIQGK